MGGAGTEIQAVHPRSPRSPLSLGREEAGQGHLPPLPTGLCSQVGAHPPTGEGRLRILLAVNPGPGQSVAMGTAGWRWFPQARPGAPRGGSGEVRRYLGGPPCFAGNHRNPLLPDRGGRKSPAPQRPSLPRPELNPPCRGAYLPFIGVNYLQRLAASLAAVASSHCSALAAPAGRPASGAGF